MQTAKAESPISFSFKDVENSDLSASRNKEPVFRIKKHEKKKKRKNKCIFLVSKMENNRKSARISVINEENKITKLCDNNDLLDKLFDIKDKTPNIVMMKIVL